MAKGHAFRRRKRIVCDIDPDEFDRIARAAIPGETTMAGKIRTLLEWGLEALDPPRECASAAGKPTRGEERASATGK